jgi:hypothetical protein
LNPLPVALRKGRMNLVFWVTVVGDRLKKLELHAFYRTLKIHVAPCSYTHSCTFNRRLDTCIVVSFCTCAPISYQRFCIYLHGMRRQACTTGAGKAAAWQHGRAPNLVIHIPISGCVSRCRIGITPILRLGRRDHDRTRIYNRAIQFPTAATSTAACMHACTPQPRTVMAGQGQRWCVVAQRPPSLLRLQQQQPDGGHQASRPSGTSSSHATSAAGIFFAAMHSMGCGAKHARPRSEWHGPCMPQSGMSE